MRGLARCLLWLVSTISTAATPTTAATAGLTHQQIQQISQLASDTLQTKHLPGIAVAVAKGESFWSAGFGKADLEQDVPVTAQSRFRIASIGKWMTATAALRLVEQGKLDLDAPIQTYCPQFPAKPWPISSRELLAHTSGVRHNYGQNNEKPATEVERKALDELIQRERSTQYNLRGFTPADRVGRRPCFSSFPRPTSPWPSCATWTVLPCARPWPARSERSPRSRNKGRAHKGVSYEGFSCEAALLA